jgi:hypothetical protein
MTNTAEPPHRPADDEAAEQAAELHRQQDQAAPEGLATSDNPPPGNVTPS